VSLVPYKFETATERGYNSRVPSGKPEHESSHKQRRHGVYASETFGLVLIALLLLIISLARYWHNIHWSLR